ncbi:hypothetical protein ZIOFF_001879 [Zingiber officinale]|uniref:Apyrase 6 n=1 Tax=Zingiber officinale TaxID=94328 RepID=A0A8J5IL13_ZINOF|nr:hypothetical protein ZIOFF_001879 [Zingiber officinale]
MMARPTRRRRKVKTERCGVASGKPEATYIGDLTHDEHHQAPSTSSSPSASSPFSFLPKNRCRHRRDILIGAALAARLLCLFVASRIPREVWEDTKLRLMATAGLRLLNTSVVNRILESCRKVLRSYDFRLQNDWASVISGSLWLSSFLLGSDEGIYAWVAATGIFELGGASAQITFVSRVPLAPEFFHLLTFGKVTYNLCGHSSLNLGQFFGLGETSSLSDLILAREKYCSEDWLQIKNEYHTYHEEDLSRFCFSSAYILALLHDTLGIDLDDRRIVFTNQVGNVTLDWALGAFIVRQALQPRIETSDQVAAVFHNESWSWLSSIVASILLILTAWLLLLWLKPKLKNIWLRERPLYTDSG